jgi:hypothetical protein
LGRIRAKVQTRMEDGLVKLDAESESERGRARPDSDDLRADFEHNLSIINISIRSAHSCLVVAVLYLSISMV